MLKAFINFLKNLFSDQRPEYIPSVRVDDLPIKPPLIANPMIDEPPKDEIKTENNTILPIDNHTTAITETEVKTTETIFPTIDESENSIVLHRYSHGEKDTLGKLYIDNQLVAYTLEDKANYDHERVEMANLVQAGQQIPDKLAYVSTIKGDTRIPVGKYNLELRKAGGLNTTYEIRFGDAHKGMLMLQDVPGFSYVYFHIGRSNADTKGCILIGKGVDNENDTKVERNLMDSQEAYLKVYNLLIGKLEKGEKLTVLIQE